MRTKEDARFQRVRVAWYAKRDLPFDRFVGMTVWRSVWCEGNGLQWSRVAFVMP